MLRNSSLFLFVFGFYIALTALLSAQPLAEGREKFFGNIINDGAKVPANWLGLWNQVTPENAGKWASVEGVRNNYQWANLDKIYQFAKSNGLPFKEHTFVWGQQYPGWIATLDSASQRDEVEEWIRLFGERYPNADFIDVVNEPTHDQPPFKAAIGGAGVTGYDWVIWAFEKAREFNPDAKLHLNEYGVLNGWVSINTYIKIINLLKERNLIDGIGLQGHFLESTSAAIIRSKLDQLAKTGLPIYITEYDLNIKDDAQQLAKYQEQIPALYEHPAVAGITLWGYIEGQIWRTDGFLIHKDGSDRPAMTWLRQYFAGESAVHSTAAVPTDFVLHQNFPNPFNPETSIEFTLPATKSVTMTVFDMNGHTIRTLIDAQMPAGAHVVTWNGLDEQGLRAASGIYFYRMDAGEFSSVKKMSLFK
jgi:endo-1,4-beta-xylanase